VHFDNNRLLHSEIGMSVRYRDGWGCYSWHGVSVPGEWIENKTTLDPKSAITWPNMEQRTAAIEIIGGWHKVLHVLDARTINADSPQIGTLVEVQLPDLPTPTRFNQVLCGTNRTFAYAVPSTVKTAREAQAYRTRKTVENWTPPEVRT
jgi:hypothetical protein